MAICIGVAALLAAPPSASAVNPVSFSPAGNMTAKRDGPGAALLPDGRVLVVGGYQSSGDNYLNSTEIYNPSTNSFSPGPTLPAKLYAPQVASLSDGRVLIAGGYDGDLGNDVATARIFNPQTGTFSPVGDMVQPLELGGAARLSDGRIMIVGGYSNTDSVNTTEFFNPSTNTFSAGPALPISTYGSGVAAISGGRVLIAGGYDSHGLGTYLSGAFVFNPSTGAFTPAGGLPGNTYGPAAASLPGGRALVAGGYDDNTTTNYLTRARIFDPSSNSFSATGLANELPPPPREEMAAAELKDGRVLIVGGWDGSDGVTTASLLSVPSNSFKAKLNGRKVVFKVSNEGTGEATDVSTKLATTAKKKKPKLVKTTTKKGGPGKIVVKVKLTKRGAATLAAKGKLQVRVAYIPDGGLAKTKKLKLRG